MFAGEERNYSTLSGTICVLPGPNQRVGGRETEMTQGFCLPNEHNDGVGM
jgi:hypothetical protein